MAGDELEEHAGEPEEAQAAPDELQAVASAEAPADGEGWTRFPVVGIGASAGGLAAFERFFAHMPAATESGMAFVVVQHLDPHHTSMVTDLIQRFTKMMVFEVTDGM